MIKTMLGALLCLIGALLLAGGLWFAHDATQFVFQTESTTGEIVDHEFTGGLNSGYREVGSYATQTTPMYAPVVAFETEDGKRVRFRANWSEGDPPVIGTSVPVHYRPEAPTGARIGGTASLYGGAAIFLLIGAVFLGAGWLVFRAKG